jgi:hypothetical protein
MDRHQPGAAFAVCVVVNRTSENMIKLPPTSFSCRVMYRQNVGMNIGAWDHGWRENPGHADYLFLQDECYVVADNWLKDLRARLYRKNVGLLCESMNLVWDRSWEKLRRDQHRIVLPEHEVNGRRINRVDFYLKFLKRHSVPVGRTGKHARSLVWFLKARTLDKIKGFPIGVGYGECIAAEIAVSKKVEALGLKVDQADGQPFRYIRHIEWNQDCPGAPFTHKPLTLGRLDRLHAEIQQPSWGFVARVLRNRLRMTLGSK